MIAPLDLLLIATLAFATTSLSAEPTAANAPPILTWHLRDGVGPGPPQQSFAYGTADCHPVRGDWDGDGDDNVGAYCGGQWHLRIGNGPGPPDLSFAYGGPEYSPVVGDWDGDMIDGIGVTYGADWYLRDDPSPGPPERIVSFGAHGYRYVSGDWDGDRDDSLGAYVNGWWYLRETTTPGAPDHVVNYGIASYTPVVGDWDGRGGDSIGAIAGSVWHLRQSVSAGPPEISTPWGMPSYVMLPGDWDGDGGDDLGAVVVPYWFSIDAVPPGALWASWRPGCPVAPAQLRVVSVARFGFDERVHTGTLVVHEAHASQIVAVFGRLFDLRFPIERMEPIEAFGGDDGRSMAANNTSAFNCRAVTGGSGFSQHSYGWAIDVNPVQNPYVNGPTVLPEAGRAFLDRTSPWPGLIQAADAVVSAFQQLAGWSWGGDWRSLRDYQHFSATGR